MGTVVLYTTAASSKDIAMAQNSIAVADSTTKTGSVIGPARNHETFRLSIRDDMAQALKGKQDSWFSHRNPRTEG